MKNRILILAAALAALAGCQKKYELNPDFSLPTELDSPAAVALDVTSTDRIVLSWTGGGAADGGIVLYEVLFDKQGGDFSAPVDVRPSDQGAKPQLTLSHAELNAIARKAGIPAGGSGNLLWTVRGTKGGQTKTYGDYRTISVTRGEGIDNIPAHLFIAGTAATEAGQAFRTAKEGEYVIVTRLGAGNLYFTSEADGGDRFYASADGKIAMGDGAYELAAAPSTGLARLTADFNALSFKMEEIAETVNAFWNINGTDFMELSYVGKGTFEGIGEVMLNEESWGIEERYGFRVEVDGAMHRWGSHFANSEVCLPNGKDDFWYVYDQGAETSQWDYLWKMDHAMDQKNVKITLWTNKEDAFTHSVESAGDIVYEQPSTTPEQLFLKGAAAELDGQPFRKVGDKFIAYARLKSGALSFPDENGVKYFIEADKGLYIGPKKSLEVTASTGVTRVTVDFAAKKVSFEEVSASIDLVWGWTQQTAITLNYQGAGKFVGEGHLTFPGANDGRTWDEERYYFYLTVDGAEKCWGRLDGVDDQARPDGGQSADYFHIGEFDRDQWSHLWKMASALSDSDASVTIDTNDGGAITHSFVKQSADPFPPATAPSELKLSGTAAESEGQAFRLKEDGVFVIYTKLKDGKLCFKGDGKTYFWDATGLLQGSGTADVSASTGEATRITVDFKRNSVTLESVDKVRIIWSATYADIITLSYAGSGEWTGTGGPIRFLHPGEPQTPSWCSWIEERYYFTVTLDGSESTCIGRLDSVDGENRPDGGQSADFFDCTEFAWEQWSHCWKMASAMDDSSISVTLSTCKEGVMTHSITKI